MIADVRRIRATPEQVERLLPEVAQSDSYSQLVMGRVSNAVVFAQAKRLIRKWTSDDVKKALEPESLSLVADGWRDAVSTAYRSVSRRQSAAKGPEESEEAEAAFA